MAYFAAAHAAVVADNIDALSKQKNNSLKSHKNANGDTMVLPMVRSACGCKVVMFSEYCL